MFDANPRPDPKPQHYRKKPVVAQSSAPEVGGDGQ